MPKQRHNFDFTVLYLTLFCKTIRGKFDPSIRETADLIVNSITLPSRPLERMSTHSPLPRLVLQHTFECGQSRLFLQGLEGTSL